MLLDKVEVAGRRIGKFANAVKSAWEMQHEYERRAAHLIQSIQNQIEDWAQATFDGTYLDAKTQSNDFLAYKNSEKRAWVTEKRELDTLLGNIQTKLKTYNMSPYFPPAGLALSVINRIRRSFV